MTSMLTFAISPISTQPWGFHAASAIITTKKVHPRPLPSIVPNVGRACRPRSGERRAPKGYTFNEMCHLSLGLFFLTRTILATDESETTLQAKKPAISAYPAPAGLITAAKPDSSIAWATAMPCNRTQTSLDSRIDWTLGLLAPCSTAQLDFTVNCFAATPVESAGTSPVAVSGSDYPAKHDNSGSDSSDDAVRNFSPLERRKPHSIPEESTKIHWKSALSETLLSISIMHTFNLWTEAGTRDTLYGHWFQDYLRSVSELRGWSDSDRFMAPYIGHSIQGSSYGFTLRLNDPKYRNVQWGDGRDYWISVLRSMAFSAAAHAEWKTGPFSEASIGNVMLHASPGFITLVDTPTLGALAMIGEDALDRYLIIRTGEQVK